MATTRLRKRYCLLTTQGSNQFWLKFTIKPASTKRKLVATTLAFALINILSVIWIRKGLSLDRNMGNLLILAIFVSSLLILRRPPVESFTVYRNYGLQVTKVKGLLILPDAWNRRWMAQGKFIPRDQILDIVINEGFVRGFQVVFYLAVIVKESKRLELLFPVCSTCFQQF
ncbi:hypothetical protein HG536_0B03390 [Torulaspora globosa]|uniref:Phosphatidylinositol N-acetylglucosaminyltransferase subunit H conserved domain-containing protein n=1 Tax=Torulaspora globosa TaxID=48254 RepID=A0A7G3ZD90_9SACH|nr:uncharacterized protein HG536_0B03390 [Torulaspora globosa]QLL31476.1 hypothetical protein HG536_0B03390 [Torulaspora globosa]